MRAADTALLASNHYDVYLNLEVDGIGLTGALGFNPVISATWTASIDQLAATGQIGLHRGTFAAGTGTSPYLLNSRLGSNFALPRAGKHFRLETAVMPKGIAPSGYTTVFDGRIDGADAAGGAEETTLTVRDMMGCFLNRVIEPPAPPESPDGKNGFLVPSTSLGGHLATIRALAYPDSAASFLESQLALRALVPIGDPQWTVVDTWVQYGQNVAEQMNLAVLQRGWNFHYRYTPHAAGCFALYDPDRERAYYDYVVQPHEVIRILRCTINDQDVTNVWDLIWGRGSARSRIRAADPVSIIQYGRRYGSWPEDQAGSIDTSEESSRMVALMLLDTKDPIVELDYERLYFWPVELGDQHLLQANLLHTSVDLSLRVIGYTHTITPKSMRTVVRTRGSAVAAKRRWKRGQPRMTHVGLEPAAGVIPEHALVLTVESLEPPV